MADFKTPLIYVRAGEFAGGPALLTSTLLHDPAAGHPINALDTTLRDWAGDRVHRDVRGLWLDGLGSQWWLSSGSPATLGVCVRNAPTLHEREAAAIVRTLRRVRRIAERRRGAGSPMADLHVLAEVLGSTTAVCWTDGPAPAAYSQCDWTYRPVGSPDVRAKIDEIMADAARRCD